MQFETNQLKSGQFNGTSEWIIHPSLQGAPEWNRSTELLPSDEHKAYEAEKQGCGGEEGVRVSARAECASRGGGQETESFELI